MFKEIPKPIKMKCCWTAPAAGVVVVAVVILVVAAAVVAASAAAAAELEVKAGKYEKTEV